MPHIVLVFLFLCALLALYYERRRRNIELVSSAPTYKGCLPLVGHMYMLMGGIDRFWENALEISDAAAKAGGVIIIWNGPLPFFCINDPDDAFTVLSSCLEKNYYYKVFFGWFGDVLITSKVPRWKRNRKLLNPTFSQHVLDGFLPVFNRQAALLARGLEPHAGAGADKFDPTEFFHGAFLETICQTAVGISLDDGSIIDAEYKKVGITLLDGSVQRLASFWLHPEFLYQFSALRKTMDEAVSVIRNMSATVLKKRRAERNQIKLASTTPRRFIAFLDLLLDLSDGGSFSDEEILRELDLFIGAGVDTSARTLLFAMVHLGTHQLVQDKLYQEIMSVLGPKLDVSKADMGRLVYTEAVVKEVLRLSPVAPVVARNVHTDLKLKNCTIPAGSGCGVSIWGIHRLPMWGPDALQFRPERWLEPATLPRSPGAFCGFSLGSRNCIGKSYALMAVKTMLVHLVRKYRVSADHSKVKLKFEILLKYVEGQHISLQLREEE